MALDKLRRRKRIRQRIRKSISGNADRPRMSVFRSNKQIYVQFIDDDKGHTLLSISSRDKQMQEVNGNKTKVAEEVGKIAAERAKEAGINRVVFDRSGYRYHGRVKALAETARKSGLNF